MKVILTEDYLKIPEGGKYHVKPINHDFEIYSQGHRQIQKGYNFRTKRNYCQGSLPLLYRFESHEDGHTKV